MTVHTDGPAVGDAFGTMLEDCWSTGAQPGTVHEIIERDDGFVVVDDVAPHYFGDRASWSEPERWGVDQATGRVLDVGCGAGRHGLALAERGHEVVGIDPSPGVITVASDRGLDAVAGSAAEIPDGIGTFDTILLLGSNLGLLRDRDHARLVLDRLASVARPGAALIGSSHDPAAMFHGAHSAYLRRNIASGRMPGQTRMRVRYGFLATPWFDFLYLSPSGLRDIAGDTPWRWDTSVHDGSAYCARLVRA